MNKEVKGALLATLGGACWGISGSVGQYLFAYEGMDSKWLVPIRLGLAGILILIYCFIRHGKTTFDPWKTKRNAAELFVYGVLGISCCQFLYFVTIQYSSAAFATILQETAPIFILTATCLIEKRSPKAMEIGAIILAILGIVLITTHGDFSHISFPMMALAAGVGSAFCVMIYNVVPKHLLSQYPVILLQGWAFLMGGILFACIFQSWNISYTPSFIGLLGIAFVVVVGNILAFTAYVSGVNLIGPNKAILYGFAEPLTAAIISFLFMHTSFGIYDALGFGCVFVMLVIISINKEKEKTK